MKAKNLPPDPTCFLASFRSMGYIFNTALADVLDNSLSAYAKNIHVTFRWNNGHPWVAIVDDGEGMTESVFENAMRFGSQNPYENREKEDLGRFGLGMKTASLSQCKNLTVCSKTNPKSWCAYQWDFEKIINGERNAWEVDQLEPNDYSEDETLQGVVSEYISETSGTVVLWRNVDVIFAGCRNDKREVKFDEALSTASKYVEMIFHRFINPGAGKKSVGFYFNGRKLSSFSPFGDPENPARQDLPEEEISVNNQIVKVRPFVLPHRSKTTASDFAKHAGDEGYLINQGFYVYRNGRLIEKATWFRIRKKEEKTKLIRVQIDFPNSLDHEFRLDVAKSKIILPESLKQELRRIIDRISDAGKRVVEQRATPTRNTKIRPIWKRELNGKEAVYSINEEHLLISDLLSNITIEQRSQLRGILKMITEGFPSPAFYSDFADDSRDVVTKSNETETITNALRNYVASMKESGMDHSEIKESLSAIEIPNISKQDIEIILNNLFL